MEWGSWHGAHCFNWMLQDRASVTSSGSQLHKYLSHGCCTDAFFRSEATSSLGASFPQAVCEVLSWLEINENLKQMKLLDQGKWTGQRGISSTIKQNLSWIPQVWLTFVIVHFLSIKAPFLFETCLCLLASWGRARPMTKLRRGTDTIPYSLFAWSIRCFHQGLEFSGSDAGMQGPLEICCGRQRWVVLVLVGVGPDGNLCMLLGYLVCPLLFSKLTIFSLPMDSELCCQPLKASLMLKSYVFGM